MSPMVAALLLAATLLAATAPQFAHASGAGPSKPAPKPHNPTYAMFAAASLNGQFAIAMSRRESADSPWVPHTCNASTYGAACNQPVLADHSSQEILITYALKNTSAPVRTWKNGVPTEVIVRLDYAPISAVDRGWRKKNGAWPGCGYHAKWVVARMPYSPSGQGIWQLEHADEVTDAVLYPEVCVLCRFADGSEDYCQCDRRGPTGATLLTIETEVQGSITPGMRGAAIALSIFSPVFLIIYSIGDSMYYKRTGRSLRLGHL
ncbi:hypothetical protein TSOC_002356 [Tetrabaena socialis]|uniref:Uncharacterized protein n=1 Tax=Tetrabaena socialis TaxID=47790 RepID=A0A2J8AE74_9CHLO|nr:hypothetical protein TSOC_002356 [Tetrabaena socialis]|eukprot:PNH10817.1 hypothetical protein TSOC_002356 [Tetrabaena socialis]